MEPPKILNYGRYIIRAGKLKSGARGIAYLKDKKVIEASSKDVEGVIEVLKEKLDKIDIANNEGRRKPYIGTVKDYVDAFISLDMAPSYSAMLKAHANAANRTMTLNQLAQAANYESLNAAILHYGTLARQVVEFCNLSPRKEKNWSNYVYTCSLADFINENGELIVDDDHHPDWAWQMHEEVFEALKSLNML
ncbi:MAG: hypothetical protein HOL08_07930 [Opitutae bacterium]|nr:hypothetical protein [Opitutae bacterium]